MDKRTLLVTENDLDEAIHAVLRLPRSEVCLLAQTGKREFEAPVTVGNFSLNVYGDDRARYGLDTAGVELVALFDNGSYDAIRVLLPIKVTVTRD